jgi:hypothetical protein
MPCGTIFIPWFGFEFTSGTSQAASHNAELRRVVDLRADVVATHQIVHGYGDCYSPLDGARRNTGNSNG